MCDCKQGVKFAGTVEQEEKLKAIIEEYKQMQGALMPILQKAQDLYGYLPIEVQKMIAKGLEIPLEEVYGVVTFYSQFSLAPKGKYKVSVCLGTACYVKGSGDIYEKFVRELGVKDGACTEDGMFSLEACRCIGACGLAPVITVNEDVHGRLTVGDVEKIIATYKAKG
ncbi:NADH-quinone oxidoreductase subunit NuoE family protein [Proteocatella sphenisci]|uniref:NADH-quinone oxidoreductase subunit NuoE family protein n=1 Tax=Proteocatella sphenisci TaxID=181070 RepID=UPI00048D282B|nr:NAD(P)H-dependent oxidoreductase subunit E [Proteocatella sphenisci]